MKTPTSNTTCATEIQELSDFSIKIWGIDKSKFEGIVKSDFKKDIHGNFIVLP